MQGRNGSVGATLTYELRAKSRYRTSCARRWNKSERERKNRGRKGERRNTKSKTVMPSSVAGMLNSAWGPMARHAPQ